MWKQKKGQEEVISTTGLDKSTFRNEKCHRDAAATSLLARYRESLCGKTKGGTKKENKREKTANSLTTWTSVIEQGGCATLQQSTAGQGKGLACP